MTTAVRPRPIVCVTAHEHRSRAVADDVVRGRFTVAGETRELGLDPAWRGAHLPDDEEWRIEWVKFGWGLDLAHAGHQAAWERLTASWIRDSPPDADAAEVTARRVLNWIYAWQRLDPAPEHAERLLHSLAEQVRHVRGNLAPRRNHRTLELYALFVAGLAFPELADGDVPTLLHDNLVADFRADGVHVEASTHYHCIALRSFVGVLENARLHDVALPDGFEATVERARRFAIHCRRPDGTIPALSDADTGDYSNLLPATAPAELDVSFPDGGYHVQRSGWDARARFLIFDCGPLGDGGHGHYDLLSFEAHANGRPLVLDPGRGSYSEAPPNLRRWFRATAAHNTVCVDGLDQTPYTRGRPDGPVAHGRLLTAGEVLEGEAHSPAYEAVHRRRIIFAERDHWIVQDDLRGEREHRYDLRFHLPPGDARVHGNTVIAPGVTLTIEGATPTLEPGWIAPRYGELVDAPVVSAAVSARDARFTTVVRPL
jgi:uncharacterized heparinase superfamily protein